MLANGFEIRVNISPRFQELDSENKRSALRAISDACIARAAALNVDLFAEIGLRVRVGTRNLSVDRAPFRNSLLNAADVTLLASPEPGFEKQAQELLQTLTKAGLDGGVWSL